MMSNELPKATYHSTSSIRHGAVCSVAHKYLPSLLRSSLFLPHSHARPGTYFYPFALSHRHTLCLYVSLQLNLQPLLHMLPLCHLQYLLRFFILPVLTIYSLWSCSCWLLWAHPRACILRLSPQSVLVCVKKKKITLYWKWKPLSRTFFSQRKLSDLHAVLLPPPLLSCFKPGTLAAFELHTKNREVFVISLQLYLHNIFFFFKDSINDLNSF